MSGELADFLDTLTTQQWGMRARLNYGDCFSYALATVSGEPLLFKGDDFSHTDVRAVPTG
ncbi:hypothetical protein MHPYR_120040 [uncultured Mycobacterium sp.]|uniref:Uncharacterized protein n=1 Tax=uncultured Mycobacterium sp. TaxID=171292 RepID=A0A1Y5P2K4_9MYCO|nr:hypothetical protein MHPYR_120040 [uncultured Mycobacterium sp.]